MASEERDRIRISPSAVRWTLSSPFLGLGVWQVGKGRECVRAVRWALELGYRHIDTAQAYGNEESVGKALRESGVRASEVFVTTKFHPAHSDPAVELEKSLKRLALDYVDVYLVHWPAGGPVWAWPGIERAREAGHARSIGVSNFSVDELPTATRNRCDPAGRQPGSVQPVRVSQGSALLV